MFLPSSLAILCLASTYAKSVLNQNQCSDVLDLNGRYYVKEEIRNISGIPADMAVHFRTNEVYFTLISLQSEHIKMTIQVMKPNGEIKKVNLPSIGQSTAIDNNNDVVYFATDKGVYKLGVSEAYTAVNEDVMYIAVSPDGKTIYIATFPQNRVHKITNDGKKQAMFVSITDGHGITADGKNNVYFLASKTAYVLQNGHDISIKITGLPQDGVIGFFVSENGGVYTMDERSNFYEIDGEKASAERLGAFGVNGVNTFGMDSKDNVIIGTSNAIVVYGACSKNPCT